MSETITIDSTTVKDQLSVFCNQVNGCGFEGFVVVKTNPKLRLFHMADKGNNSFRQKIRAQMLEELRNKFLNEQVKYAPVSFVSDNQHKNYLIPQIKNKYEPFGFINETPKDYQDGDLAEATGLIFSYRNGNDTLWLYQHLWGISVPNKKRTKLIARLMNYENLVIFDEQTDDVLTIDKRIDVVILNGHIITENIKLMQSSFGFQTFIQESAKHTISRIEKNGIVSDVTKLHEYISRGKLRYAKKLMRITDSKVLMLQPSQLIQKVQTIDRWKGKFQINRVY